MVRFIFIFLTIYAMAFADLKEEFVAHISFSGLGSMKYSAISYYKGEWKKDHSVTKFKSKGFLGKIAAKLLSNDGKETIYDLKKKVIYDLDLADETYTERDISKFEAPFTESDKQEVEIEQGEESEEDKSYKVLREVFKVIDKNEDKKINNFDTHHYIIYYVSEVQDLETKKIRTDSMFIDLYNSNDIDLFKKVSEEKKKFYVPYYKLLGLEYKKQDYYDQIFGKSWFGYLNSINKGEKTESVKYDNEIEELKKIKGYPILINGAFFHKGDDKSQSEDKGFSGGFSGLVKKISKEKNKKGQNGYKKLFSYKYELINISFDNIDDKEFEIPNNFDKM